MYGQYGHYQNGISGAEDSSLSGTLSFPGAFSVTKKKKIIPLHLRPRRRTAPHLLKPLFPIGTSPESPKNAVSSNECDNDVLTITSENSNSDGLTVMNTSFIDNSVDSIKESGRNNISFDTGLSDYSGNLRESNISNQFLISDSGHLTDTPAVCVEDKNTIQNYDPLEDLLPSQTSNKRASTDKLFERVGRDGEKSMEIIKEEILNFQRITQASSLYIEHGSEKNEMAPPLTNAISKSGKQHVLQDIINQTGILHSKVKSSDVKGTPKYSYHNEDIKPKLKNTIDNKENELQFSASRLGVLNKYTPAKNYVSSENYSELDLKTLYQTPGSNKQNEKKAVDLYTPVHNDYKGLNVIYETSAQKEGEVEKRVENKKNDLQMPLCLQKVNENVSSLGSMTDKRKVFNGNLYSQKEKIVKKLDLETPLGEIKTETQELIKETSPSADYMMSSHEHENSINHFTPFDSEDTNDLLSCGERSLSVNTIINKKDAKESYKRVQNEFSSRDEQKENLGQKVSEEPICGSIEQNNFLNSVNPYTGKMLCKPNSVKKQDFELKFKERPPEQIQKTENCLTINGKTYILQCILGRGGSSKVFQVLDKKTAQQLAVKQVDLSVAEPTIAQGYLNEIAVLRQLQGSESVIKMIDYEYLEEKQLLYVAMEKGETDLSKLIKDITKSNQIPMTSIVHYWTEMLRAVKNIHENGVIHSDLKPANFLLVCGRLKLIDFGIASSVQSDMTSVCKDTPAGTYNYISPEALQVTCNQANERVIKISFKSDIWSLGCILYNLIYGHTPFQHIVNIWSKLAAITNKDHHIDYPTTRKDCPPVLLKAVKQCLTFEPKKRPTAAELLELPYLNYNEV